MVVASTGVVIPWPYRTDLAGGYRTKVANGNGSRLQTAIANRIRLVSGLGSRLAEVGRLVRLPPREPDAIEREAEHLRRARVVTGFKIGAGHSATMAGVPALVAPNKSPTFGKTPA